MTDTPRQWTRFAALGDSITEGWCDPVVGSGEPWFGWADRLALEIDRHQRAAGATGRLEFANLAVRGRRVRHVVEDQIPVALDMRADLVSVLIGGNDLSSLRPDPDALAAHLQTGIAQLATSGATVLLATAYDPGFSPYLRPLRGRAAVFTAHVHTIAARHGCRVLDLWSIPGLAGRGMWSEDRLHPSTRCPGLRAACVRRRAATGAGRNFRRRSLSGCSHRWVGTRPIRLSGCLRTRIVSSGSTAR